MSEERVEQPAATPPGDALPTIFNTSEWALVDRYDEMDRIALLLRDAAPTGAVPRAFTTDTLGVLWPCADGSAQRRLAVTCRLFYHFDQAMMFDEGDGATWPGSPAEPRSAANDVTVDIGPLVRSPASA